MCMGFWVGMIIYSISKFDFNINCIFFGFIISFIGTVTDMVLDFIDLKIGELKNGKE